MKRIIDISKWNAIVNFSTINKSIDGAIVRAGFSGNVNGTPCLDSRFFPYIIELNKNNVPVGAYYLTAAISTEEAKKEAQFFIGALIQSEVKLSLPIFVCTEWTASNHNGRSDKLTVEERTEIIKTFIDECKDLGYVCCIMAAGNWLDNNLDMSSLSDCSVWTLSDNVSNRPNRIMNRTSERFEVKGIAGYVCLNELYTIINPYVAKPKEEKKEVEKKPAKEKKAKTYKVGGYFNVKNREVYKTSISSTVIDTVNGRVYITNATVRNNRIRITNSKDGETIGWINI